MTKIIRCFKELADAGAWPKDVLGSKTDAQDTLLNGTGASMFWNIGTCQIYANQANAEHPDWNVTLVNILPEEYGYGATKYRPATPRRPAEGRFDIERKIVLAVSSGPPARWF